MKSYMLVPCIDDTLSSYFKNIILDYSFKPDKIDFILDSESLMSLESKVLLKFEENKDFDILILHSSLCFLNPNDLEYMVKLLQSDEKIFSVGLLPFIVTPERVRLTVFDEMPDLCTKVTLVKSKLYHKFLQEAKELEFPRQGGYADILLFCGHIARKHGYISLQASKARTFRPSHIQNQ